MTSRARAFVSVWGAAGLLVSAALAPTAVAKQACWQELVADWSDGAISNLYPIDCYREALRNMPEDVRLYSSASDDINRALASQAVTRSLAGAKAKSDRRPPSGRAMTSGSSGAPLVLAGSLAMLLALAVGAGYLTQRKWRGAARLRPRH